MCIGLLLLVDRAAGDVVAVDDAGSLRAPHECCEKILMQGTAAVGDPEASGIYRLAQTSPPAYLSEDERCSLEWEGGWVVWCFQEHGQPDAVWWAASEAVRTGCPSHARGWEPVRLSCASAYTQPPPPAALPVTPKHPPPAALTPPLTQPTRARAPAPTAPPDVRITGTICIAVAGTFEEDDLVAGVAAQLGIWPGLLSPPRPVAGCAYGPSCGFNGTLFRAPAEQHVPAATRAATLALEVYALNALVLAPRAERLDASRLCERLLPGANARELSARCHACMPLPRPLFGAASSLGPVVFASFDASSAGSDLALSPAELAALGLPLWVGLVAVIVLGVHIMCQQVRAAKEGNHEEVRATLQLLAVQDLLKAEAAIEGACNGPADAQRRVDGEQLCIETAARVDQSIDRIRAHRATINRTLQDAAALNDARRREIWQLGEQLDSIKHLLESSKRILQGATATHTIHSEGDSDEGGTAAAKAAAFVPSLTTTVGSPLRALLPRAAEHQGYRKLEEVPGTADEERIPDDPWSGAPGASKAARWLRSVVQHAKVQTTSTEPTKRFRSAIRQVMSKEQRRKEQEGLVIIAKHHRAKRERLEGRLAAIDMAIALLAVLNLPLPHAMLGLYSSWLGLRPRSVAVPASETKASRQHLHKQASSKRSLSKQASSKLSSSKRQPVHMLKAALLARRRLLLVWFLPITCVVLAWQSVPLLLLFGHDDLLSPFSVQAAFTFIVLRIDENLVFGAHAPPLACLIRGCGMKTFLRQTYLSSGEPLLEAEAGLATTGTLVQAWATLLLVGLGAAMVALIGPEPTTSAAYKPTSGTDRSVSTDSKQLVQNIVANIVSGLTELEEHMQETEELKDLKNIVIAKEIKKIADARAQLEPLKEENTKLKAELRAFLGALAGAMLAAIPVLPGLSGWAMSLSRDMDSCMTLADLCDASPWRRAPWLVGAVGVAVACVSAVLGWYAAVGPRETVLEALYPPPPTSDGAEQSKYVGELIMGFPHEAASGLYHFIQCEEHVIQNKMHVDDKGCEAIEEIRSQMYHDDYSPGECKGCEAVEEPIKELIEEEWIEATKTHEAALAAATTNEQREDIEKEWSELHKKHKDDLAAIDGKGCVAIEMEWHALLGAAEKKRKEASAAKEKATELTKSLELLTAQSLSSPTLGAPPAGHWKRLSWQRLSGRNDGDEGYEMGDATKSLVQAAKDHIGDHRKRRHSLPSVSCEAPARRVTLADAKQAPKALAEAKKAQKVAEHEEEKAIEDLKMAESGVECLHYVLYMKAGSSPTPFQHGWVRDRDKDGSTRSDREGKRFAHFAHHYKMSAKLDAGHVLALRLYTTDAFRAMNTPMRRLKPSARSDGKGRMVLDDPPQLLEPHPLPVTMAFLYEGLKKMRGNVEEEEPEEEEPEGGEPSEAPVAPRATERPFLGSEWKSVGWRKPKTGKEIVNVELSKALLEKTTFSEDEFNDFKVQGLEVESFIKVGTFRYFEQAACQVSRHTLQEPLELWRGMRGLKVSGSFEKNGGTELAPMSTSNSLEVALEYARGAETALIFRFYCRSFMNRGCAIQELSAFPHEHEYLFPPLTYLKHEPEKGFEVVSEDGTKYKIVEVEPFFPS